MALDDYDLDSFSVTGNWKKKPDPSVWIFWFWVIMGMLLIGSCQNQMDKERAAQQAAQRH